MLIQQCEMVLTYIQQFNTGNILKGRYGSHFWVMMEKAWKLGKKRKKSQIKALLGLSYAQVLFYNNQMFYKLMWGRPFARRKTLKSVMKVIRGSRKLGAKL